MAAVPSSRMAGWPLPHDRARRTLIIQALLDGGHGQPHCVSISVVGLNNDIARSHLETLIERITGIEKAAPTETGDYFIKTENAGFFARVDGDDVPVIRVFSVVAKDVEKTPELLESLNEINAALSFVRTTWSGNQVVIGGEALALSTDVAEFSQVCRTVAMASDHFGPQIVQAHGGKPFFEQSKDPGYQKPEPDQPGYL
jgi:hypothetical protein